MTARGTTTLVFELAFSTALAFVVGEILRRTVGLSMRLVLPFGKLWGGWWSSILLVDAGCGDAVADYRKLARKRAALLGLPDPPPPPTAEYDYPSVGETRLAKSKVPGTISDCSV